MISLSDEDVTQGLHICLGAIFILLPVCWEWHFAQLWGTGIGLIFAAVKEFFWDIRFEDPATSGGWKGSTEDFYFYVLGIVLGNVAVIF